MGKISSKLRGVGDSLKSRGIMHWCAGCDQPHIIWYDKGPQGSRGPVWQWDGNISHPTVSPSVRMYTYDKETGKLRISCHYSLRRGNVQFHPESIHALAGKTVELPDWP